MARFSSHHPTRERCADFHSTKQRSDRCGCVHICTECAYVQDVCPQEPGADDSTADDSQLTQPADSQSGEVSTAARASEACAARKRKAGAWLLEETAGDTCKQPKRTSSALDFAATCCPGGPATFHVRGLQPVVNGPSMFCALSSAPACITIAQARWFGRQWARRSGRRLS